MLEQIYVSYVASLEIDKSTTNGISEGGTYIIQSDGQSRNAW